jgi:hypothetical protein
LPLQAADTQADAIPDWVHDALVVPHPAAAVGGCQAGIYTPAVNGVRPWRQAIVRWLTGRHVMGNTAVLVRQEGSEGGAGLPAVVDPNAEYLFQVTVFVPGGGEFGEPQDGGLQLSAVVLGADDKVIAEAPVVPAAGKWTSCRLSFRSGPAREVRCIVRARAPRRLPCVYYVDEFRLTRPDVWWNPQNLFDAARTAVRVRDEREALCRSLDPDAVGGHNGLYLNWDGFFTRRGIAVGGGFWEQEYNHVAADDPAASRFLDDGVARNADGEPIQKSALWPGYHMCHNAPGWHAYQQQRFARIAPEVQLLGQDNICAPSFEQAGRGCFCRWCRDGFRRWLRERWTGDQLRDAGITDLAAFNVASYVRTVAKDRIAKGRDAVLADPVLRALVQFHYVSQLDRWRDTVAAVKKAAGHPVAVCGNQWGAWGQRPYSVALSQIGDMVGVEAGGRPLTAQNRAWDSLATKLGAAAGEYRRPVWLYLTSLFHASEAARSRLRSTAAQAWADGGVPTPWATMPGASGWFYDAEAGLCRFVQRHRALFARRERCANVGLVFSLPTHAWRKFPALNLTPGACVQWFGIWARLLEEAHIPYEVNCWWDPLLGNDAASLARLARYQVLVLPGVDCFTDAQRDAVRALQARGGRVISVACPSQYDNNLVRRPAGDTLATPDDHLLEIAPELMAKVALAVSKPSAQAIEDARVADQQLTSVLRRGLGSDVMLETDASSQLWANLWLDDTRQILALHLVNGDIDLKADRLRPAAGTRWRVRLPKGLNINQAAALSPDEPGGSEETKPLAVEVADGWATVMVPSVESYTIVALSSGETLKAASDLAAARRSLWRASICRGGANEDLLAQMDKTLALLRAGKLEAGAPAAADLVKRAAAILK